MSAIEGWDRAIKCHRHHRHWFISMAATGHIVIWKGGEIEAIFSHICTWGMTSEWNPKKVEMYGIHDGQHASKRGPPETAICSVRTPALSVCSVIGRLRNQEGTRVYSVGRDRRIKVIDR